MAGLIPAMRGRWQRRDASDPRDLLPGPHTKPRRGHHGQRRGIRYTTNSVIVVVAAAIPTPVPAMPAAPVATAMAPAPMTAMPMAAAPVHIFHLRLRDIVFIGYCRLCLDLRLRRLSARQRLHGERRGLRGRRKRNGAQAESESCFQKITALHRKYPIRQTMSKPSATAWRCPWRLRKE